MNTFSELQKSMIQVDSFKRPWVWKKKIVVGKHHSLKRVRTKQTLGTLFQEHSTPPKTPKTVLEAVTHAVARLVTVLEMRSATHKVRYIRTSTAQQVYLVGSMGSMTHAMVGEQSANKDAGKSIPGCDWRGKLEAERVNSRALVCLVAALHTTVWPCF